MMSDKLAKSGELPWGEDVLAVAGKEREAGIELSRGVRERILALYLMRIRAATTPPRSGDPDPVCAAAIETMKYATPASSAKESLCKILEGICDGPTRDLFEEAMSIILEELEQQRKLAPAPWIVDTRTGRAVAPATSETILQPPDYVGLDGKLHKSTPVVHPDITSAMAMARVAEQRQEKLQRLASDPVRSAAYRHLIDPQSIAASARERLRENGMQVLEVGEPDPVLDSSDETVVEFGRENVEADLQSVNESFHRVASYAAVLAVKISRMCGPGGSCSIGRVEIRTGPKERWFEVPVRAARVVQA